MEKVVIFVVQRERRAWVMGMIVSKICFQVTYVSPFYAILSHFGKRCFGLK